MTNERLLESKIRQITKKILKEANFDTAISKFAKLSGLTPKKTTSNNYPVKFIISNTVTLVVSNSGKFVMSYILNGKDEYLGSFDSANGAWRAVEQGNYMHK